MGSSADIYSMIRPQEKQAGPLDNFSSMLQLRHMIDTGQLNDLQRQKLSGDLQEEQAFKSKIADWAAGGAQGNLPADAYAASPARAASFDKSRLDAQTSAATLAEKKMTTLAKGASLLKERLPTVKDEPSYQAFQQFALSVMGPEEVKKMNLPPAYDPEFIQRSVAKADEMFTPKIQPVNLGGKEIMMDVNPFTNPKVVGMKLDKTQTPDSQAADARARESLTETKRHHAALEGDPATIEQTAQAIAKGQLAPLSGFALARPMAQNIMARVAQINPDFDPTQFQTRQKAEKDFATGKQGNSVRSFNVALSHLDTLDQLADALNNKDTQLLNKIGNVVATQTGSAAPTNFVAAKKIVSDEIVKAIVGSGGGVTDREEAAKSIASANSPAQLKGVINTYKELMRGQLGGLRDQYKATTGKDDFDAKYLSESGRQVAHGKPAPAGKGGIKFLGFE